MYPKKTKESQVKICLTGFRQEQIRRVLAKKQAGFLEEAAQRKMIRERFY